jgi:hypothetical protein
MSIFNSTAYSRKGRTVVQTVAAKTISFLEKLEDNAPLSDKLEKTIAQLVSTHPDVEFCLVRLCQKYDFPGQIVIMPKVNAKTLLIESYDLMTNGNVVISADNAEILTNELTQLVLSDDTEKVNAFLSKLKAAYDARS